MNRLSWPAIGSVVLMVIALVEVHVAQWDRYAAVGIVFALCSIAMAMLALRDR